ncbi:hypothetical protein [Nocardia xishanensis]
MRADGAIAAAGISIGSATLYDRPTDRPTGPVGTCVVTTLFNARRRIDFASTASAELRQRAMLIGLGAHRRRTEIRAAVVPTLPISSGS